MVQPARRAPERPRVFVTGGTGTVGQAMVARFAERAYDVHFQYRSDHMTAGELASRWSARPVEIDFLDPFTAPLDDVDVLVNSAGVNEADVHTHDIDEPTWERALRVNLTVPFLLTRAVVPPMMERGWGRIINVGSGYSLRGAVNRASYVASKHGLSGLTKTVAKEYGAYGITCNEVCPGAVESEMVERLAGERARREGKSVAEVVEAARALNPARRMATADEIASVALYLASDEAAFVNGASIPVDGGMIA